MWVEKSRDQHMQIVWTGRGPNPRKEKEKMKLVCDECLDKFSKKDIISDD